MPSSWQLQKDLLSETDAAPSGEGPMAGAERLLLSESDLEHFPGKIQPQMLKVRILQFSATTQGN